MEFLELHRNFEDDLFFGSEILLSITILVVTVTGVGSAIFEVKCRINIKSFGLVKCQRGGRIPILGLVKCQIGQMSNII